MYPWRYLASHDGTRMFASFLIILCLKLFVWQTLDGPGMIGGWLVLVGLWTVIETLYEPTAKQAFADYRRWTKLWIPPNTRWLARYMPFLHHFSSQQESQKEKEFQKFKVEELVWGGANLLLGLLILLGRFFRLL
jgi:hypothetical protein